jgi:hypothetical protein
MVGGAAAEVHGRRRPPGARQTPTVYVDGMADRREEHFEVVTTRIGGGGGSGRPGRRRRVPIALVIVIALAIPAIAWMGPRIEWRPEVDLSFLRPTPTPVPSATP